MAPLEPTASLMILPARSARSPLPPSAYDNLVLVDRDILDEEMTRTGLANQSFESDNVTPVLRGVVVVGG
eukprot:1572633-Pyramimonas_sp.AAC.1